MPRYFFNVFGSEDLFDEVGIELPSRAEARQRMILFAMEIIGNCRVNPADGWQMEVLNEMGEIVGTMDFCIEYERPRAADGKAAKKAANNKWVKE